MLEQEFQLEFSQAEAALNLQPSKIVEKGQLTAEIWKTLTPPKEQRQTQKWKDKSQQEQIDVLRHVLMETRIKQLTLENVISQITSMVSTLITQNTDLNNKVANMVQEYLESITEYTYEEDLDEEFFEEEDDEDE